jgi:hypothetical protein
MSKAWFNVLSLAGIVGSSPAGAMDVCFVNVVCCEVEASAMGRSFVQRSPTEWGVSYSVIVKPTLVDVFSEVRTEFF